VQYQIWYASPSKKSFKAFNNALCNIKILKIRDTFYTTIHAVEKFSMLCILCKAYRFYSTKHPGHGVGYINHIPLILYCKIGLVYVDKFSNDNFS